MILNAAPRPRALEFFTLREAERVARGTSEGVRLTARRCLALARQKHAAAEALWPHGNGVEALTLARAALEAAVAALDAFAGDAEPPPPWLAPAAEVASAARQATVAYPFPELDSEARADDEFTFRTLTDAVIAIDRTAGSFLDTPAELASLRRARVTAAVTGTLVALVLLFAWSHKPVIKEARASAHNGPDTPDRAIDGNPTTNWGLPERENGWFELVLSVPRAVKALRVIPYNVGFENRVTRNVHINAFLGDQPVRSLDYGFPEAPASPDPAWVTVPLDAPKCDRIRIEVKTFDGMSASISEIELQ